MRHLCLFFFILLFLLMGCEEGPKSVVGDEYRGIVYIDTSVVIEFDSFVIVVPQTYGVKYEVTGLVDSILVRFVNEDGVTCQVDNVFPSWAHSFRSRTGDSVRISGRNLTGVDSVKVYIHVDGRVFRKA